MRADGNQSGGPDDRCDVPHETFVELVSVDVDGELADDERIRLEAHLETCADCRERRSRAEHLRRRLRVDLVGEPHGVPTATIARRLGESHRRHHRTRRQGRRRVAAMAIVAAGILVATLSSRIGGDRGPVRAVAATIHAQEHSFDRSEVEVSVGEVVEIANSSEARHLLVQEAGSTVLTTSLRPGEGRDLVFNDAGTYELRCRIHEGMAVTVRVRA